MLLLFFLIFLTTFNITTENVSKLKLLNDFYEFLPNTNGFDVATDLPDLIEFLNIFKTPISLLEKLHILDNLNVSAKCVEDFKAFAFGLIGKQYWALKMLDAYGKIGSGITQGNIIWPGSYSICNKVIQGPPYVRSDTKPFIGQYCWITAQLSNILLVKSLKMPVIFRTAVCVPDSCVPNDLHILLAHIQAISKVNDSVTLDGYCVPASLDIWTDRRAVICLIFCGLMAAIILIATVYDLSLRVRNSNENEYVLVPRQELTAGDEMEKSKQMQPTYISKNKITSVKPGICSRVLLSFSFYTNAAKLFNTTPSDNSLLCLNGIRVLSMAWIILSHTATMGGSTSDNILTAVDLGHEFRFNFVFQGMFSVDTFFILSGLLVTYIYLKNHDERNGNISWFHFYFHRFWRLTPVYAVTLFVFYDILSAYFGNGPLWSNKCMVAERCDEVWWKNLLYVNNFGDRSCMGHTWYLAVDMQFYIISPLILFFLTRHLKISAIIASSLILTNWVAIGLIVKYYNLSSDIVDIPEMMNKVYSKPYCRIAPYVIGMICGYLLYRSNGQTKLNKIVVGLCWLIAAGVSYAAVFGTFEVQLSREVDALYLSLTRSAWAIAVCWMIYACCTGYGGVVNSILSWPVWQPFARLTYSSYLIHNLVIGLFLCGIETPVHMSPLIAFAFFFASLTCSFIAAIFISLSFEAPCMALEKLFL